MDRRLLLAMMGGVAYGATADRLLAATESKLAPHPYLPNPVLYDQTGNRYGSTETCSKGRFVVINMMYTVCTQICPLNIARLREVQTELGDRTGRDVHIVFAHPASRSRLSRGARGIRTTRRYRPRLVVSDRTSARYRSGPPKTRLLRYARCGRRYRQPHRCITHRECGAGPLDDDA